MPMQQQSYQEVRDQVRPGDVIAFGGHNPLSEVIKQSGDSVVSHAGLIVAQATAAREPQFVEATVAFDKDELTLQVKITSFRARHEAYDGEVWWLPLHAAVRADFDEAAFLRYVHSVEGAFFDLVGGLGVVIKGFFRRVFPDFPGVATDAEVERVFGGQYLFCSQLVVEALKRGHVKLGDVDADEVTPGDLCRWKLYQDTYFFLKGNPGTVIPDYATLPPGST